MRVTINQPCPFPATYLVARMAACDVAVHLRHAQFVRRMRDSGATQNAYELMVQGAPQKMVIPTRHTGDQHVRLCDVEIDNSQKWYDRHLGTVRQSYGKSKFFREVYPIIEDVMGARYMNLIEFSQFSTETIAEYLGLGVHFRDSLPGQMVEDNPSEWMLRIAKSHDADEYYCGQYAIDEYLDVKAFEARGVKVTGQNWKGENPTLSILDLVMRFGKDTALCLTGETFCLDRSAK